MVQIKTASQSVLASVYIHAASSDLLLSVSIGKAPLKAKSQPLETSGTKISYKLDQSNSSTRQFECTTFWWQGWREVICHSIRCLGSLTVQFFLSLKVFINLRWNSAKAELEIAFPC